MLCPKCDTPLNTRLVASTKTSDLGVVRRRWCDCGACVVTLERVLDCDIQGIMVEGLTDGKGGSGDLSMVRRLVRNLGGSVTELKP